MDDGQEIPGGRSGGGVYSYGTQQTEVGDVTTPTGTTNSGGPTIHHVNALNCILPMQRRIPVPPLICVCPLNNVMNPVSSSDLRLFY